MGAAPGASAHATRRQRWLARLAFGAVFAAVAVVLLSGALRSVTALLLGFAGLAGRGLDEKYAGNFKPEADDPLDQSGQRCLILQLAAKSCRVRAYGDLAVVEFRAGRGARLAAEGDLVCA